MTTKRNWWIRNMAGWLAFAALMAGAPRAQAAGPVLIFGDSLMKMVAKSMSKELDKKSIKSTQLVSIGSGLARLDLYDWPSKIQAAVQQDKPSVAIVLMGANDNQPMKADNRVLQLGTPEWKAEYRARVERVLQILSEGGVKQVLWIGLPDVRDDKLQRDTREINAIYQAVAAQQPAMTFVDSVPMFSITPGKFSPYILKKDGMPLPVRSGDGTHFSREGADYLAEKILPMIK